MVAFKNILSHSSVQALIVIFAITVVYFYKTFLGYIALPVDLLTGAYYPWLDYKWGYSVGVPVKNPGLSDVFDELYPWKTLAADLIRSGQLPLWNPYAFSGTPLLANSQSTPFYPFNFFLIFLGKIWGWNLLIASTPFLGMFFMFLYLRNLKISFFPSLTGAVIFAFSGFMTTYMEYGTAAQTFLWIPLFLLSIDRFLEKRQGRYLFLLTVAVFCAVTSAHFQTLLYMLLLSFLYLLGRVFFDKKLKKKLSLNILLPFCFIAVGIGIGSLQLIPTLELLKLSIRSSDVNIFSYNYGLLPFKNLLTLLSPDFFGNQSTGNFWGFMVYSETAIYFGIIPLVISIWGIISARNNRLFQLRFFAVIFLLILVFIIDNPVSKLIYTLKFPVLSTTYATRMSFLLTLSASFLTAYGLERMKESYKEFEKIIIYSFASFSGILLGLYVSIRFLQKGQEIATNLEFLNHYQIALKNSLLSLGFLSIFLLAFFILKRRMTFLYVIIFVLITADLLHFSLKFNVFSKDNLIFPQTPTISFLENNANQYRFERERTEMMPPMAWIPYHLYSVSGYDPLYTLQYAQFFNVINGSSYTDSVSRYAEISQYNSNLLDLAGVKYLLVAKRNKQNVIDSTVDTISSSITNPKYKKVFTDKTTVVLENSTVLPRVQLFDKFEVDPSYQKALKKLQNGFDFRNSIIIDKTIGQTLKKDASDSAFIQKYQSNNVIIQTTTKNSVIALLTDTWFPGWNAYIDGKKTDIFVADGAYRAILLPAGSHTVSMIYQPKSFQLGMGISLISVLVLTIFSFLSRLKLKNW